MIWKLYQNHINKRLYAYSVVKVGKFWLAHYTLISDEAPDDGVKYFSGVPSYGIFSKAEYAVMKQQAARLYGKQGKKEITNNQRI